MVQRIAGPGLGLPLPQNLYPTELSGAAQDFGSNRQTLAPGQSIVVPAGEWYVGLGMYLLLQYLDPITNVWVTTSSGTWESAPKYVFSDGYTTRVANMTACPIGAVITNAGSGYVQASTSIAVTGGGGSTWVPIVGGQLASVAIAAGNFGAGYGIAPLCMIPPPPPAANNPNGVGGVPASGYFGITSGTISGFTFTNPGAGYPTGTTYTVPAYASPFDPNLATGVTLGTITFSVTAAGSLTGVLCTNSGAPLANPANVTLTVSGVGSQATVVPITMQTIVTGSVSGLGTGYGTVAALLTTVGGAPPTAVFANSPDTLFIAGKPRPANIGLAITNLGTIGTQMGTIYDGGLFFSAPTAVIVPGPQSGSVAGATVVLTMGGKADIATLQPAA